HPFAKFGRNQTEICALFPHIGSVIDEICLVRSMTTDAINHDPAHMFMNTGSQIAGRPSMGAWVTYGLGSEAADLPGFVVLDSLVDDPEISTRIAQYEMAFQMQASVPELMDLSRESAKTLELYGCQPGDGSFASNCLLARRLAERGVRFIQLYHKDWDHHIGV